ncbi:hypothetical protein NDU88_002107, partial [Pleurodeles waltl]
LSHRAVLWNSRRCSSSYWFSWEHLSKSLWSWYRTTAEDHLERQRTVEL